jgi:small-conductance mechanosensitive channel
VRLVPGTPDRSRHVAAALLFAVLAGYSAEHGVSAEESPAATPKEDVALRDSEVPRAAIAAETRIRAIRSVTGRRLETDAIAAAEKDVLESVEALKEWMRTREPRQQTPRALRSIGQEWLVDEETLGAWMETTSGRLDALASARTELSVLEDLWAATDAKLDADNAPPEIRARAREVLDSIIEVEQQATAASEKVLLLQSRISAAKLDAEEAREALAGALREERKRLLRIESPPVWKMFGANAGQEGIEDELRAAVSEAGRALKHYAARAGRTLWLQLGLFVVLVVAFYRLRRGSGTWPKEDRGLKACARLVQWPVLGAALVALLSGLWMHPRAPLALYELSSILLILPVVVVLRGVVRPELRGVLNAVAIVFAVERVWETAWAGSLLERTVLLGLTVLSAVLLAWTLRSRAPYPELEANRWWRLATVAGRVGLVALAVSLVANVVGNVSLARLVTTTVVRAGYVGVVLYAAALLLRGATSLLVRSAAARSFRTVERHSELIQRRASLLIDAGMLFFFFYFVLRAAGLIPVIWEAAAGTIMKEWGIGAFRFSIVSALVFVAALYASIVASRLIRAVLEDDVYTRVTLPRGVPGTVTMLARYGVVSLGFLISLSIAGIPLDRLAFVLGAFSVGIGFGLQTVVNNFVSGLILMFERPIQIGDAVEVSGLVGRVKQIGVRASTIETFDGAEVIVPNGTLVSGQLINWTLSSRSRRIEIQVGVAQGADPEKVLALLKDSVKGLSGVPAKPEPTAIFRGFGAGGPDFSVLFWTTDFEGWTVVRSHAFVAINRVLAESGIAVR